MKKPIEVEGQEMAFKKVGNRYKLVKDFAGKPSHEEGGHPILAEEGMVITPAKDRKKVTNMVDNKTGFVKNNARFNSYRLTLPKDDVAGKAKDGVNDFGKSAWMKEEGVNSADYNSWLMNKYPEFKTKNLSQLYPGKEMDNAINIRKQFMQDRNLKTSQPSSTILNAKSLVPSNIPTTKPGSVKRDLQSIPINKEAVPEVTNAIGGNTNSSSLLANAGRTAPIIYDLMKGSQPIEKVSRRFMNPQLESYRDRSEPLRQQLATNTYGANQVARNLSGGSAQSVRAMDAANRANQLRGLTEINAEEGARRGDTRNKNIERLNQSQGMNLQLGNQYDDVEARRRGAAQQFTRQGMTDIGALSKDLGTESYLRSRDDKAMDVELLRMNPDIYKFADGQHSLDTDKISSFYKNAGRKSAPGLLPQNKNGNQGIKVPKYKKGTRYKSC